MAQRTRHGERADAEGQTSNHCSRADDASGTNLTACSNSGLTKRPTVSHSVDVGPIQTKGKPGGNHAPGGNREPGRIQTSTPCSTRACATASRRHSRIKSVPRCRKPVRPGFSVAMRKSGRAGGTGPRTRPAASAAAAWGTPPT
eukprot:9504180-Pyramimonas_sp.AAC.1